MQKIFLTAILALTTLSTTAQSLSSSPYSRYGLGALHDRTASLNRGLGGTGIALSSGRMLNPQNAASYARIDSLSFLFDASMSLEASRYSNGTASAQQQNARFEQLALGVRLLSNLGMSLGLSPFSTIGYELKSEGQSLNQGTAGSLQPSTVYEGHGGLQEVYLGLGYAPTRNLSVGLSASYLWGNLYNATTTSYGDEQVKSLKRIYETEIRSYKLDFGLQYSQKLDKKNRLTLGLTHGVGRKLRGNALVIDRSVLQKVPKSDTLTATSPYELPNSLGVGLAWEWNNRLTLAADYQQQQWDKVTAPQLSTQQGQAHYAAAQGLFTQRHRYSLGIEYVPNPQGNSLSQHLRYRAGLSYTTPYAKIDGQLGPKVYTATVGVAVPIVTAHNRRDNYSYLNLSAQYDHVAPQMPGQLTERYLRLTLGISFNQRWFQKWKVD